MTEIDRWEFAWPEPDPSKEAGFPRAASLRAALWGTGNTIKISFLDDEHDMENKVVEAAQIWTGPFMANLTFRFIDDPTDADIRISFKHPGAWSSIGNTCRFIKDKQLPTMNLGWLDHSSSYDQIRRVVLHEFGHAIGLIHEHSSPVAGIKWNCDQVIEDLSPQWSLDMIRTNVFRAYKKQETNFTAFDKDSIMVYPIPSRWTQDSFSVELNDDLSPQDIVFIRQLYPQT